MSDSKQEAFEFHEMVRRARMTQEDRDREDRWKADLLKFFIPFRASQEDKTDG